MKPEEYDREAKVLGRRLPPGPRLAVIGSASYWGRDSRAICQSVGAWLATLEELVLLTGGVPGVGEGVGRSFFDVRRQFSMPPNTYHVLPDGSKPWDYGVTLFAGATMVDRREILGRLAPVYLSVEGGPGTAHEARVARSRGATLIPISRTGGYSQDIHPRLACPSPDVATEWRILGDGKVGVEEVALAVRRIVEVLAREGV
jgi:hypothetical protein